MGITVTTLTFDDAEALDEYRNAPHLVDVAAYVRGSATIQWKNRDTTTSFTGTTASYTIVEEAEVAAGRFFDEAEARGTNRVVVLGSRVAEDLFEGQNPIGEDVKIKRELFHVIGVMKDRGTSFFVNQDEQVFIPLNTAQKILLGINHLNFIRAKVDDSNNVAQSVEDIKLTLRDRHDIAQGAQDDFSVRNTQQALDVLTQVTNALTFFLVAIAAVALLVGGIGIMNIMLVAVNERIREVGLHKAVGATNASILGRFLVETMVVSFAGGALGIALGTLVAGVIALVANYLDYRWAFIITPGSIGLAVGFSLVVGLIFGLYPAWKAAKLDPIKALRYE